MIRLPLDLLEPGALRDTLQVIQEEFQRNAILAGRLEVRTLTFTEATTEAKVAHGLPFAPQDCAVLRKTGAGSLTIHYDLFDNVNLVLSTTGPCVVRLLVGTYGAT